MKQHFVVLGVTLALLAGSSPTYAQGPSSIPDAIIGKAPPPE